MKQPQPQSISFSDLISNIERGLVKIPRFQREFVWNKEKSAYLLDSILKGYPIGTFILWKTKESLRTVKDLGDFKLPDTPPGDFVQHVLDGQQRLTSLFASVKGLEVKRDERVDNFAEMYVDLAAAEDQPVAIVDKDDKDPTSLVRVVDLLNANLRFLNSFPEESHDILDEYKTRLQTYAFSVVLVDEAPIEVATEIFTRLNVSGKPLSVFEIMVAKTFDEGREFDLAEKYKELVERLANVDYETVPETVVLQAVSAILTKECDKKSILRLDKTEFVDVWQKAADAIEAAVEYLRNFYRIPVSRLLPYQALVVPFSYFFYHHPDKPIGEEQKYLQDLFWRISLSGRYSYALESKLAQDTKRVDHILVGELPTYDYSIDVSPEFVRDNGWFSASRSFVKALLCLLTYQEPKSFADNSVVRVSNDWLKRANSRNYHHFFPKAYLKKETGNEWQANHIANITIVDDYLNKRKIRANAPAIYMREFEEINPDLNSTMATHLINVEKFGVWENDYDKFSWERCKAISEELKKRVVLQEVDKRGQEVHTDDFEDVELEESGV